MTTNPLNKKKFGLCAPTWRLSESKISASPHTCLPGGWGACWIWEPWPTLHQKLSRDSEARWCTFWDSGLSVSSLMSRRCSSSTDTGNTSQQKISFRGHTVKKALFTACCTKSSLDCSFDQFLIFSTIFNILLMVNISNCPNSKLQLVKIIYAFLLTV